MASKKSDEIKVMDVAKPGEGKQSIGNKPMIIGHTPAIDPMVKDQESIEPETTKLQPPSVAKKVIKPLEVADESDDNEADHDTDKSTGDKSTKENVEVVDKITDESLPALEGHETVPIDNQQPTENSNSNGQDLPSDDQATNEHVQRLINSKKYFVTVHSNSESSLVKKITLGMLGLVVLLVTGVLLIDADILDIGVKLPIDII